MRILSNRFQLEVESVLTWSPITNFQLTEQQLLDAIGTSHDVMEIESDDENEMEKEDTPSEANAQTKQHLGKVSRTFWTLSKTFLLFLFIEGSFRLLMNLVSLATKWEKLQFKGEVHRADWNDILRQCDS